MKICINPGHAPRLGDGSTLDPGAVNSTTGLCENDVVFIIGNLVLKYLQAVGYETIVVQNDELQVICDTSNDFPADLFVSIHCNSAGTDQARGTETWFCDGSAEGERLAGCIDKQIVGNLQEIDRGTKNAKPHTNGLYVLTNTNAVAVLVETAFISNDGDEKILASASGKDKLARAIAVGITDYVAGV